MHEQLPNGSGGIRTHEYALTYTSFPDRTWLNTSSASAFGT
jgi:hypothetical protein